MPKQDIHELLIIGAGAGGVISLKYANDAGVDALVIEQQTLVGGLWAKLPKWQDIQYNRIDWTLGDLPIDGEDQEAFEPTLKAGSTVLI